MEETAQSYQSTTKPLLNQILEVYRERFYHIGLFVKYMLNGNIDE